MNTTMKQTTKDAASTAASSATSPAEQVPTVTTLHVDTVAATNEAPLAEDDDSPTPTAASFPTAPMSAGSDSDAVPKAQPPSYDEVTSSVHHSTSTSSVTDRESARQAALRRGAPANASSSSSANDSSNGIADLLSRFAAMLFPKYAPAPAQVVVLGDHEAPVELLVKELVRPLLGEEAEVATVKMVRGLTYLTAKADTHHVVAFPKVEGFMHKKVEHALASANQIYFLLDTQRSSSSPLPSYLLPYLKHITFICIHSLARPEKVSPKLFAPLALPADKSVTILDGSSPDDLQARFTALWRAAGDIAREKRLDKLMEAQERSRAMASGAGVGMREE